MEDKLLMKQKYWMAIVLASLCIGSLFALTQTHSAGVSEYNPWADINDDGWVNAKDAIVLGKAFDSSGAPLEKASITFDSGWIDITDKQGQNINLHHNLGVTNWNDEGLIVDIVGKTVPQGELLRYLGFDREAGSLHWSKTYGGSGSELAWAGFVQTTDGGYALAGYTNSFGAGGCDSWLVKTDASGNEQWNNTYGGTSNEMAFDIVQTGDGGYVLAGWTESYGVGGSDCYLVKTDASGNMQWNRTYGGVSYTENAMAVVQTDDDGYAFLAYTWDPVGYWLVKTDSLGNMQWNKTYAESGEDYPLDMIQTNDLGYALVGMAWPSDAQRDDVCLVKTDAAGNAQWVRTYGEPNVDEGGYALVQTTDGGYAVAGEKDYSTGGTDGDFLLLKTDSEGNMNWNKTYGKPGEDDFAWALTQTIDGGYALAGVASWYNSISGDAWLVKTDADGNEQWNRTYGGTGDDEALGIVQTGDGGFVLAGWTSSFGAGGFDFWLVKTGFESGLVWIDSSADTITLYRGITDPYWNYVRVRILQTKNP
jgi:hypothetical protein